MRTFGLILGALALVVVSIIAAWMVNFPTYSYRYRMIVVVDVDGKIHSGSSVLTANVRKQPQNILPVPPYLSDATGEAVFVDLGEGRNLIALLEKGPAGDGFDYPKYLVPELFGVKYDDIDLRKLPTLQGIRGVPDSLLPTFVTLADPNDPKTTRIIRREDFEKEFGANVKLVGVNIEMTKDPVTRNLIRKFPWICTHKGFLGGPQPDLKRARPSLNLTADAFSRGVCSQ